MKVKPHSKKMAGKLQALQLTKTFDKQVRFV